VSIRDHRLKGAARRWGSGQIRSTNDHHHKWTEKQARAIRKRLKKSPTISPSTDPTISPSTDPSTDPTISPSSRPSVGPTADPEQE
jgi:hypothetical protein